LYINPNLPSQELGRLMTVGELPGLGRFGETLRKIPLPIPRLWGTEGEAQGPDLFEGLTPALKFPIERKTGVETWLGRPIESHAGELWQAPGWATLPGIKTLMERAFGMKKGAEMPPGEYKQITPKGEVIVPPGTKENRYYLRGSNVHLLNQMPLISDVGRIISSFQAGEGTQGLSKLTSLGAGVKFMTFNPEEEAIKQARKEYSNLDETYKDLTRYGLVAKPLAPEAPYPADLYQFPEEIKWRQQEMIKRGIPLAKQADIEGAMQNILPNLPSDKKSRQGYYSLMGFPPEWRDIVEAMYKRFAKWKTEYRAPEYDVDYTGLR